MEKQSVLRTGATDLTADETLTSFHVGPMTKPLWLHVLVPEVSTDDTLDVELEFCALATPTVEVYNMNMPQITVAGLYSIPFYTKLDYVQVKLNVTAVAGPDFGAVKVWIDPAHRADGPLNA